MYKKMIWCAMAIVLLNPLTALASIFGDVRGVVRDPQQHLVNGAKVSLRSRTADFSRSAQSNDSGEFFFRAIPIGEYLITIEAKGFRQIEQPVTVISGSAPILQIQLEVAPLSQQIDITANPEQLAAESTTPTALVSREQIAKTP